MRPKNIRFIAAGSALSTSTVFPLDFYRDNTRLDCIIQAGSATTIASASVVYSIRRITSNPLASATAGHQFTGVMVSVSVAGGTATSTSFVGPIHGVQFIVRMATASKSGTTHGLDIHITQSHDLG